LCVFGIDTSSLRLQWLVRKQVDFANNMQQNRYGFHAGRQPKGLPVTPTKNSNRIFCVFYIFVLALDF
jgi:hypothetical protein